MGLKDIKLRMQAIKKTASITQAKSLRSYTINLKALLISFMIF
jgi:hypothetical protein